MDRRDEAGGEAEERKSAEAEEKQRKDREARIGEGFLSREKRRENKMIFFFHCFRENATNQQLPRHLILGIRSFTGLIRIKPVLTV
ncbi:unnamed protein product [Arabidopsis halleri]